MDKNKKEQVLLLIDGKPVITAQEFEDYFEKFLKLDPNPQELMQIPDVKLEVFKRNYVRKAIIAEWLKRTSKFHDADLQRKLKIAKINSKFGPILFEDYLIRELEISIEESPDILRKFCEENSAFFNHLYIIKSKEQEIIKAIFLKEKMPQKFEEKLNELRKEYDVQENIEYFKGS